MSSGNSGKVCAVVGCKNSSKKLSEWKTSVCDLHSPKSHRECSCVQPWQLHRFPAGSDCEVWSFSSRNNWIKNLNRKDFEPTKNSRICSIHFQDGKPSKNNPYPSLHMGYKPHKQLSSGRHAPRLRRDLKLQEQESVSVSEHAVHEMPHASPVCGETILPASLATTCKDASVQWYDFSTADHTYATNPSCPMKSQVKATQTRQTDTSPELSASDMGDDTSKFYTGLSVHVF
ncbi:uncharacterized protein LOC119727121 [Patiria miniata]|uniref:THAP-type domain-containing protein n=1 Tax=Patiria miniata TaxID=46514 RepID=A0A913ZTZ3_PATMI|nr:uncharacterized protein LOC119727121 [Patiria miniata]